jgi:hypothetical protein
LLEVICSQDDGHAVMHLRDKVARRTEILAGYLTWILSVPFATNDEELKARQESLRHQLYRTVRS